VRNDWHVAGVLVGCAQLGPESYVAGVLSVAVYSCAPQVPHLLPHEEQRDEQCPSRRDTADAGRDCARVSAIPGRGHGIAISVANLDL
jgi:hypothetical protein